MQLQSHTLPLSYTPCKAWALSRYAVDIVKRKCLDAHPRDPVLDRHPALPRLVRASVLRSRIVDKAPSAAVSIMI